MERSATRDTLVIVILYTLVSLGWYGVSEGLMPLWAPALPALVHVVGDIGFILLTSAVLGVLLRSELLRRRRVEAMGIASLKARDAAQSEKERLTRILDAMEDCVSIMSAQQVIEYANPALIRRFGPLDGRSCHEYFTGKTGVGPACPLDAVLAGQTISRQWRPPDSPYTYDVLNTPLYNPDGSVSKLMILRDVTSWKQAEEDRERLLKEVDAQRELFQMVVEHAPAGIAIVNGADLRAKWANAVYLRFLEEPYRSAGISGLQLGDFIPQAEENGLAATFRRVAATGEAHIDPEFAYDGFARGTTYWQWSLVPLPARADAACDLLLLATEITDQVHARRQTEQRNRELATLLDVSRTLAVTLDLPTLLDEIFDELQALVGHTSASVVVLQGEEVVWLDYRGALPPEAVRGSRIPLAESPTLRAVMRQRDVVIIPDLLDDTPAARAIQEQSGQTVKQVTAGDRSTMAVPLIVQQRVIGMLRLGHSTPNYYTSDHARLALALADQAAVAIENARLYQEAQRTAALEERQRLARDLHDSVSQSLYGMILGSQTALERLNRGDDGVGEALRYVVTQAEGAMSEMRALIFELRPESLEREGLCAALTKQIAAAHARYSVDVRTELCEEPDLPLEAKEALFRIAQEALHNAGRHSGAAHASVRLYRQDAAVGLEVSDDGAGFDPNGEFPGHLGMKSMRERAQRLGGVLEIESAPARGTLVRVTVPRPAR